jgi:hypothetical protein
MTVADFLSRRWTDPERPLIQPPALSPVIADPSFLFPEETPDGTWRLFAHSAWGLHAYSSTDGLDWRNLGLVLRHAMRPFVRRIDDRYYLYYERYKPFALPLTVLPKRPLWASHLEVRSSPDLRRWSAPTVLLRPDLPWTKDGKWGDSVSNPCLAQTLDGYRLYYSAGLAHVPDCGFEEPRYLAAAQAERSAGPAGPFVPRPAPIVYPADDPLSGVIGAGSLKAVKLDDGWLGLQNKIYTDGSGLSRSALFVLGSADGLAWKPAKETPFLAPSPGWRSSHVYACDVRYRPVDGKWYVYYNARDGWYKTSGRERIGRLVGEPGPARAPARPKARAGS